MVIFGKYIINIIKNLEIVQYHVQKHGNTLEYHYYTMIYLIKSTMVKYYSKISQKTNKHWTTMVLCLKNYGLMMMHVWKS